MCKKCVAQLPDDLVIVKLIVAILQFYFLCQSNYINRPDLTPEQMIGTSVKVQTREQIFTPQL